MKLFRIFGRSKIARGDCGDSDIYSEKSGILTKITTNFQVTKTGVTYRHRATLGGLSSFRVRYQLSAVCLAMFVGLGFYSTAHANNGPVDDGTTYSQILYPNVGSGYYAFSNGTSPYGDIVGHYCSFSLISDRIAITAIHCFPGAMFNRLKLPGNNLFLNFDPDANGYDGVPQIKDYWSTVDYNNVNCFLEDIGHPAKDFTKPCKPAEATPGLTFHKVAKVIRISFEGILGVPQLTEGKAGLQDVALVVLENPINNIEPLQMPEVGALNAIPATDTTPTTSVGRGWDARLDVPPNNPGLLANTVFYDYPGTRRIANVGPIIRIQDYSVMPRENPKLGDNLVCYSDSGGPLLYGEPGESNVIIATLTGRGPYCDGHNNPWARVDTPEVNNMYQCVKDALDHDTDPCVCGNDSECDISS